MLVNCSFGGCFGYHLGTRTASWCVNRNQQNGVAMCDCEEDEDPPDNLPDNHGDPRRPRQWLEHLWAVAIGVQATNTTAHTVIFIYHHIH